MLTSSEYEIHPSHLKGFENCINDLNALKIENLFDLQNMMEKILSENSGISQFGVVGLYIRRIVVVIDRMSFSEMLALHKSILLYYEKGLRRLTFLKSPKVNENNILDAKIHQRNDFSKWSIKQAELFVAQQIALLENNEIRSYKPIVMQKMLNKIINDNPLFSQAYFLSYMNNLRLRDFYNSIYALHRSFDRNPVQIFHPFEIRGVQYSSLNLAILHANFNHKEEALSTLKECIILAQESGDHHCLQLANAWFCILNDREIKLKQKFITDQTDLITIQSKSLNIQFIVKVSAFCGFRPTQLFELLLKSNELNCKNSLMELIANCFAQRSALWTLYGESGIASLCSQALLKLNKSWAFGDVGNSESICQVLCCLALWFSIQGELTLSGTILYHTKERFIRDPLARSWMICDCYITINQAIYKHKWQDAIKACYQLYIFDKNAGILQKASINIAKRNLHLARRILHKFLYRESLNNITNDLDSLTKVKGLILLAYTMIINENVISPEIIDILNKASTIAKVAFLGYEEAIIDMIFAYVFLHMKMPKKALKTIKSCMGTILTNGGIYDRARVILLYTKCLTASVTTKTEKLERISECIDMLNDAVEYFKKLEAHTKVKDVYNFLTIFYHEVELYKERNNIAFKLKRYDQEFPTAFEYINVFF